MIAIQNHLKQSDQERSLDLNPQPYALMRTYIKCFFQERVEYIHVKGPAEKGHVELAISKPKAGGGCSSFWLCTELQCSFQRIRAPLSTRRGGGLPQKGRGGGFSGLNTKPAVPNHSINQSGFPNKFFGLDAMNNRITRERAYRAIHVHCTIYTSHTFRKYFNFLSPSSKYIYDIPIFQLLPLPFYPIVAASRNVFDRYSNFRERHFSGGQ
jgi:hypothetical protein